uniref:Protein kinase domain-containing protein n=1 Tax=Candidatus Caldatribacterium californiense TaxID=1454726 RepID=A0A7V4DHJ0_9BACT
MRVTTVSPFPFVPKRLEVEGPVFVGGEGEVYFSRCGNFVVKVYHDRALPPEKEELLRRVLALGKNLGEEASFLCWPVALVREIDGWRRIGVVTKRIPRPPFRELVDYIFSPREFKRAVEEGANWLNYLQVAHSIARTVAALHGKGCAHADLHFGNFLVDIRKGLAVLIDLDGLVVPGFLPPQVAGMMPFMAPEVVMGRETPNQRTDRHSLAVLVFHTLLLRNPLQPLVCYAEDPEEDERLGWGKMALFSEHPLDFRNRPERLGIPLFRRGVLSYRMLPPHLQELIERSFLEGLRSPEQRPLAREWERALFFTFFELWRCLRCTQYFPYPYWMPLPLRRCPFCGETVRHPHPVVCSVLERKGQGVLVASKRKIVLGHRFNLVAKMLHGQREDEILGEVQWKEGEGYVFSGVGHWQVVSPCGERRKVEPGERVLLGQNLLLVFGDFALRVEENGL